jgi:hypothetical protein
MAGPSFMHDLLRRLSDALSPTWAWPWQPQRTRAELERSVAASKDALDAIRGTGDWRSIPSLLYILAHNNAELRRAGAAVISDLAALIPVAALPGFEGRVRELTLQGYSWNELGVDWIGKQEWPARVWAMFTMHPSGYVREAALRRLASEGDATLALPYFLLRANDWVDQVRDVALEAVKALLVPEHAAIWVSVLGLVDQLRVRSRNDHAWLTAGVSSLLVRPELRPALMDAARSQDRSVGVWTLRVSASLPDADRAMLVSMAMESADPVVRLRAAKAVRAWAECPGRERLLATIASDRFMPIRREALYAVLDDAPERCRAFLRAALLDRHASMRHAAMSYLTAPPEKAGESLDTRTFYLGALAAGKSADQAAAILGVGECGTQADAERLVPFAEDDRPMVAAAAVRAVAALDRDHRVDWFVELLRDGRPAVAREAGRALELLGNAAPVEALRDVLRGSSRGLSRRYALRILLRRHPYDAVVDAVVAAGSADAALIRAGSDFIERARPWRVPYGPSEAQKAAAEAAIRGLSVPLAASLRRRLREFMGVGVG